MSNINHMDVIMTLSRCLRFSMYVNLVFNQSDGFNQKEMFEKPCSNVRCFPQYITLHKVQKL